MHASDVAKLYNIETKVLNQTIKRNIKLMHLLHLENLHQII